MGLRPLLVCFPIPPPWHSGIKYVVGNRVKKDKCILYTIETHQDLCTKDCEAHHHYTGSYPVIPSKPQIV